MKSEIETQIAALAKAAGSAKNGCDAQQFSQAALNLANTLAAIDNLRH